jgi:hypothetical protein
MTYEEFVKQRAEKYGLTVAMAERVGLAFWTPEDPLSQVISQALGQGQGNGLEDWLNYASSHDLSAYLTDDNQPAGKKSVPFVQEMGERDTNFGRVLYIKIRTDDYRQLSWREVWQAFHELHPGRWAVQFFPSSTELVDEFNVYHLFVLEEVPSGMNINHV